MFSIVVYALLLGLCFTLFVLLMWQREAKSSTRAHSWRLGHEQGRAQAKAAYAQQVQRITAYEQLLQGHLGGVGKRLADTREVAELIQRHAPGLLKEADGLAHLLHGNDEFLSQLLNVYVAADQDAANAQLRAAARRPAGVYADVFEAAGVAAPGSIVGKHFGLALEAGLLVIRATGQHGGSGKITLARRDLERFFNDLAAKPRSLGEELAAAVTCRGLYRVDMHGDARLGQLVVEVAAPSSGRLYLGAPQQEEEPLRELKSLKRASLRLLEDEAKSTTRRTAAQRARILRRDALLEHLPESGLCGSCEGDVTMRLRLGDKPMCCPLCGTRWAD
ncbi:hypothetical protein [Roseateles sp. BYS96W]|uniref:Uncharacterized protein n=1 Tax=Pelomonas nitida TaxID=3299027 RepID=A0ABW7GAF8_9BURK